MIGRFGQFVFKKKVFLATKVLYKIQPNPTHLLIGHERKKGLEETMQFKVKTNFWAENCKLLPKKDHFL